MASSLSSIPHADHIVTLEGQGDYARWFRYLKPVAKSRNLWSLLSGDEQALERPRRPTKPQFATISLQTTRSQTKKAADPETETSDEESKNGVILSTRASEAYEEVIADFKFAIVDYRLDLDEFEIQDARIRQARGLLAMSVDPAIRGIIADIADPHKAFLEIKSIFRMSNTRALGVAFANIEEIKFTKKDTVASFLNNILLLQSDINDLSGSYSDDQVIAKVLRSLPSTFLPFIIQWNLLVGTPCLPNTIKELYSQLLIAEARFPKMTTHPRDKRRQSGRIDKHANRLLPCFNKMGTHAEDECWIKHPELRKANTDKSQRPRVNLFIHPDDGQVTSG
jgi:hypothetical protein